MVDIDTLYPLRQMFRIFLSSSERFDGLRPAFWLLLSGSFFLFCIVPPLDDLVCVDFSYKNTPHSVVSKFCYFECLFYGEHIRLASRVFFFKSFGATYDTLF